MTKAQIALVVWIVFLFGVVFYGVMSGLDSRSNSIKAHQEAQTNECRDRGGMPIKDNAGNLLNCSFPPWKAQ